MLKNVFASPYDSGKELCRTEACSLPTLDRERVLPPPHLRTTKVRLAYLMTPRLPHKINTSSNTGVGVGGWDGGSHCRTK